jgi:hypothetical protein
MVIALGCWTLASIGIPSGLILSTSHVSTNISAGNELQPTIFSAHGKLLNFLNHILLGVSAVGLWKPI